MATSTTLRDIAKQADCNVSTVSLALRNDPRVKQATQKKILRIAHDLNYVPNPLVSALMAQRRIQDTAHGKRTREQGTVLAYLDFLSIFESKYDLRGEAEFYRGAEARAESLGYRVERFRVQEKGLTSKRLETILRSRGIPGLIIGNKPMPHGHLSLKLTHFASVSHSYTVLRPELNRVAHNHFTGVITAIREALKLGYKRPGLALYEPMDISIQRLWSGGFLTFTRSIGHIATPIPYIAQVYEPKPYLKWYHAQKPDVIISCFSHDQDWLRDGGISIPDECGYIHLDASKKLSGISQRRRDMGAAAVDSLIAQLNRNERGLPKNPKTILINGRWRSGQTTKPQKPTSGKTRKSG